MSGSTPPPPDVPELRTQDVRPSVAAGGDDDSALTWNRVHPVTPLVRGWAVLAVAVAFLGQQTLEITLPGGDGEGLPPIDLGEVWWIALLVLLAFAAVAFGAMWLAWRKTSYAVGAREVHHRKGVLFRQQRHARLDRLQAVDIRQPVVARLCGMAELRLEVAGGADSTVVIGFLREGEARQLRAELLARAAGIRRGRAPSAAVVGPGPGPVGPGAGQGGVGEAGVPAPGGADGDGADGGVPATAPVASPAGAPAAVPAVDLVAQEAPEQELYVVPPGRLAMSLVRSPSLWGALAFIVAMITVTIVLRQPSILFSAVPALFGMGSFLFNRFAAEFNFRAAMSPDGIRVRRGLLETRAQTVPPGRVQAVSLIQGPLWRKHDWWRVKVNVAGYQQTDTQEAQSVLLPVGTRAEALTALWLVVPDLGVVEPLPLLDEGLTGIAPQDGSAAARPDGGPALFTNAPRRARIVDPLAWRRDAYAVTSRALLLRRGRLVRRLDVVPHERMQSVAVEQGPLQRRLRVATFAVHSTPGAVVPRVPHLDEADAAHLLREQAARARAARAVAGPERWMEALAQGEAPPVPAALVEPVAAQRPAGAEVAAGGLPPTSDGASPEQPAAPVHLAQRPPVKEENQ